ncbi:MAG: phage head closure protein [Treponema sp.]|nr:phage head closure protein [Candidatus Treponema caballi]
MWKKPYRPNADVTQSYNDGILTVYSVADIAQPGYKPVEKLTFKVKVPYEERSLGINRFYSAKQNQTNVERVVRIPKSNVAVTNQDIAITEDGEKYRIDLVQKVSDIFPPSFDLTLEAFTQSVTEEESEGST